MRSLMVWTAQDKHGTLPTAESIMDDSKQRFCLECNYNLYGLVENRCPGCGKEFDPEDPSTFATKIPTPWHRFRYAVRLHYPTFLVLVLIMLYVVVQILLAR